MSAVVPSNGTHRSSRIKQTTQLQRGEARSLRRNARHLRVVSGHAWITFDGQDMYLDSDQELTLSPGRSHAVVVAIGDHPLVYEIG